MIKPIKTEEDYEKAIVRVNEIFNADPDTKEGDELEVLTLLIARYEEKNYPPIDLPHPVEAIKFRMEQQGLEPKDLVPIIGTRGRVSEILNRKRPLTLKMIRALHRELHISVECLVQEYRLAK